MTMWMLQKKLFYKLLAFHPWKAKRPLCITFKVTPCTLQPGLFIVSAVLKSFHTKLFILFLFYNLKLFCFIFPGLKLGLIMQILQTFLLHTFSFKAEISWMIFFCQNYVFLFMFKGPFFCKTSLYVVLYFYLPLIVN